MTTSTWELQAGDASEFALKFALVKNPHGHEDLASAEDRESWGFFTIWVKGENLCLHREQGELTTGAHWYLLSLVEWIVDIWDPLFHEERMPLRNAGASAAESLSNTRNPPISLKEIDEFAWLEEWAGWWQRHNVRAGREGGLFPDLYVRRYRDEIEFSTGSEDVVGTPQDFGFLARQRTYRVPVATVVLVVHDLLRALVGELRRRLPESARLADLAERVVGLADERSTTNRLAWLAGYGHNLDLFRSVARAVDDALANVDAEIRSSIVSPQRATPLAVEGALQAQLVYGAFDPRLGTEDIVRLSQLLAANYVPDASEWLHRLHGVDLSAPSIAGLTPGEQGSMMGEEVARQLATSSETWVDIASVLDGLDILSSDTSFSDKEVRAITVFGGRQRPHIFLNTSFYSGNRETIRRFTLAHELCHLLLDRERGADVGIASGPWAPIAIEQRANAFAAGMLMPTWLLRDSIAAIAGQLDDLRVLSDLANSMQVSQASLIDRLYNLGELSFDERIRLRTATQARYRRGGRGGRRPKRGS